MASFLNHNAECTPVAGPLAPELPAVTLMQMHWRVFLEKFPSFINALQFVQTRRATDPRDLVYSILSLVPECEIVPDYSKSVHTLYRDVVEYFIRHDQNLDCLSL